MASLQVQINGDSQEFVERQVQSGAFGSADEFIDFLIQGEMAQGRRDEIERQCLIALDTEEIPLSEQFFDQLSRQVRSTGTHECPT